ncbi:MAG TPA: tetratricopeptide repeat protein, partial [Gammaproteobacteria bacterium]
MRPFATTLKHLLLSASLLSAPYPVTVLGAAFDDGLAAYRRGDLVNARQFWEDGARADDPRSMFSLGALFATGKGVEKDTEFAYSWFLRAAEAGLTQAQYNVGLMLEEGNGVDRNPQQARTWYERAARNGLVEAQMALGTLLWGGRGIEADTDASLQWFRQAAERGYLPAAQRLAQIMEEHGEPEQAQALMRRFAELGHAEAQNNLGAMLENGVGTPAAPAAAATWYRRAADQDLGEAQVNLARLYAEGKGVPKDPAAADYWTARARRAARRVP